MIRCTELHVTTERHVYITHNAGHNILKRKYLTLYTVSSLSAIFLMMVFEQRIRDEIYHVQVSVNFYIPHNKHLYHISANFSSAVK